MKTLTIEREQFLKRFSFSKLIFLLSTFSVYSSPKIHSLIVSPTHPNSSELIKIIAYTGFSEAPAIFNFDSLLVNTSNYNVKVNTFYQGGGGLSSSKSIDTVKIGKLIPGNYKIVYNLAFRSLNSKYWYTKDSIYFTVLDFASINSAPLKHSFSIYPNPLSKILTIVADQVENVASFLIIDQSGRIVLKDELSQKTNKIDIEHLPSGLYFLHIGEAKKESFKFMKK